MKIKLIYNVTKGPRGGGNQFLKALRSYLADNGLYEDSSSKADILFFNSYENMGAVTATKKSHQNKFFVHRVDGPIRLYNTMSDPRDYITNTASRFIADGTVFQSTWSMVKNYEMGFKENRFETVIHNAPDPALFNTRGRIKPQLTKSEKIRLIAASWSHNWNKGFNVYSYLDKNLDFSRYDMTFVGNTPVQFTNITHIQPVDSPKLAALLKQAHIYITASKADPCSNSLLEALHCGLPCLAVDDGGHPELIGTGGLLFNQAEDIPALLERLVRDYEIYHKNIKVVEFGDVMKKYVDFFESVLRSGRKPKKLNTIGLARLNYWCLRAKLQERFSL